MTSGAVIGYRHSRRVERLLHKLALCICPPEVADLGLTTEVIRHVELSMAALSPMTRRALLTGLMFYDLSALPQFGRRASELDIEQAQRLFARWWHGAAPKRELAKAIKGLLCLACYELPAMQERIGYRPEPWIASAKSYRLQTYAAAIRHHENALREPDPIPLRASLTK